MVNYWCLFVDGYPLEMGAQWLHGSDGNPLYSPLTEHNLIEWRGETLDDSLLSKIHRIVLNKCK